MRATLRLGSVLTSVTLLAGVAIGLPAAAAAAGVTGQVAANTVSDDGAQAFADVATCASGADHLLAAVVVDESGSLQFTDPEHQRVGAIVTALDSLSDLASASDGALQVQATLATFGTSYEELVGWGEVDGAHEEALRRAAVEELPRRNRDNFTDYRAALGGAQSALTAREASLSGNVCKVVLWFTDGRLDVDGTGAGPETEAAWQELCAPQGIVDGVRGDGVVVLGLALFTDGGSGSVTDADRDRLKAVVEGQGEATTCGTVPVPASAAGGAYLAAEDAASVRRMFARAAALIAGGAPGPSAACPDEICIDGTFVVPTDAGIGGFRLVVERAVPGQAPQLVAPDGSAISLEAGTGTAAGAEVSTADRDGLLVTDVQFPSGSLGGEWQLVTDPSAASFVDLYYFWGVTLELAAPEGLVVGETGEVSVSARYRGGGVADLRRVGDIDLAVQVDGGTVLDSTAADDGTWLVTVDVPRSDVPPVVSVEATARGVTQPSGIVLGPVSGRAEFAAKLPPSYPSIATAELRLPSIVGVTPTSGVVELRGSERGPTTACFAEARVTGPDAAGEVSVDVPSGCVELAANEEVTVDVTVTAANAADGRLDGVLPIALAGVDVGEPIVVEVPFSATMTRPVDEATRWGLIALFVLLAVAMAWTTAEVARRLGDRYVLSPRARFASVPVAFDESGIRRTDVAVGPLLEPVDDFRPFAVGKEGRRGAFDVAGLRFGRTFPWFPLRAGRAWATADDGAIVVAPGGSRSSGGRRAAVDFPGAPTFVVVTRGPVPAGGEIPGRLVALVDSPHGVAAALPDVLDEIRSAAWDALASRARNAQAERIAAAEKSVRRPAGSARPAAPPATERDGSPQPSASAVETSWAELSPQGERPPMPTPDWVVGPGSAPPPPAGWIDSAAPASPRASSDRPRGRFGRRRDATADTRAAGTPAPPPSDGWDGSATQEGPPSGSRKPKNSEERPAPPASTNFWD